MGGHDPQVCILMATCNGARHLAAQLDSLTAQDHANWRLLISDDGSSDDTRQVIADFRTEWGDGSDRVRVLNGPGQGSAANFLFLIEQSGMDPRDNGWLAFCDQDDIWMPGKLGRALSRLHDISPETPTLYCSRSIVWDSRTDRRSLSPLYRRAPSFRNALVQNIAQGNTIVLNPAATALARRAAAMAEGIFAHDWWLYQLITGAGGRVVFDPEPTLLYRQHDRNVIGHGSRRVIANKIAAARGAYAERISAQLDALSRTRHLLTPEHQATLDAFVAARRAALPKRLSMMRKAGVTRQGVLSAFSFWGAVIAGRV